MTDPKTLTDEQIDRQILDALSLLGDRDAWDALTFESGPYGINRVRHWATGFVRAVLNRATREQTASTGGQALSEPTPLPRVEVICMSDGRGTFLNVTGVGRYEDGELQVLVAGGLDWAGVSDAAYAAAQQLEPADNARRQAFMGGAKWMASLLPRAAPVEQTASTMTPAELAQRLKRGEKWSVAEQTASTGAPVGETKTLVSRIIEGERELDGSDPQTLCFLMAEHWRRVAMDYKARAQDYDTLKTKYRILRAAPVEQAGRGIVGLGEARPDLTAERWREICGASGSELDALDEQAGSPDEESAWLDWKSARADMLDTRHNRLIFSAGYQAGAGEQAGSTPDETLREALAEQLMHAMCRSCGDTDDTLPEWEHMAPAGKAHWLAVADAARRALATPTKPEMQSVHPAAVFGKEETMKVTDEMVSRFLCWRLPDDFGPDCGITFAKFHPNGAARYEPVGTNLFTADQARAMLEHVLGGER